MPISSEEIRKLVELICEEENLYVTAKESLKGGIITGASAAAGGFLLGPIGFAIGGALGGIAAWGTSKEFRSAFEVICDSSEEKKDRLYYNSVRIVRNLDATDAITLFRLLQADPHLYLEFVQNVRDFVTSDLSMTLKR